MIKPLFFLFLGLSLIMLILAVLNIKIFFYFVIYAEIFWMFFYYFLLASTSYTHNPLFPVLSFIVLYVGALEIIAAIFSILDKIK